MQYLAAIFPNGDKFRAKILVGKNHEPLDFFRQTTDRDELVGWLTIEFVGIEIVTQYRFQMELDHIRLFGCRSDDPSFELPIERLGEPSDNRMSTDVIIQTLDAADKKLDEMENTLNAILPSPLVEHDSNIP